MKQNEWKIRTAEIDELPEILEIYRTARAFMAANGNGTQWGTEHPKEEVLRDDIQKRQLYVVTKKDEICGVFAMISGEDPTYKRIDGGSWRSDEPYQTIHRIASSGKEKGVFEAAFEFGKNRITHLRIDTHENNKVMQHLMEKYGFQPRGIIYLPDGSPRIAYDYIAK
ncbi:MAG: N-acetyltransferase [Oscillospiraceae bacterium]|nr:N-acetyltransferase [Oscillospiraceae bacterium]